MSKKWRKQKHHPQSDKNHVHPKSRGGPNSYWNKRPVNYDLHHGFNEIFKHNSVYEGVEIIRHIWTDEYGNLKYEFFSKKQIEEWFKIFGTLNTSKAIDRLLKELAHKPEHKQKYENWLIEQKEKLKDFVQALERQYKNKSPT